MTARTTFEAAVKAAAAVKVATDLTTEMVRQTTIDAQNSVVGYTLQNGNYANLAAAVASAQKAALAAGLLAEATRQNAIIVARDTLRSTGDVGPA